MAVIYYAPTIFSSIGLSYNTSLLMAGIMNILQLVGVSASIPLMDPAGRKPLLIFGGAGMLASQLCLAIIVGLYSQSWATHSAQGWVGVGFICKPNESRFFSYLCLRKQQLLLTVGSYA